MPPQYHYATDSLKFKGHTPSDSRWQFIQQVYTTLIYLLLGTAILYYFLKPLFSEDAPRRRGGPIPSSHQEQVDVNQVAPLAQDLPLEEPQ